MVTTGVVDTNIKFITGVVDTDQFFAWVIDTSGAP